MALSAPEMMLCSLPMTRLSVTDELLGWLKLTVSWDPMEKPCQLMMALLLDWLMLVVLPDCEILAEPSTTVPPVGPASAASCSASKAATAVVVANEPGRPRQRECRKPGGSAEAPAAARSELCFFLAMKFSETGTMGMAAGLE
nr:hypothetical protein [Methylocapsa acidiphila]